jgi:hypothetical protein
MKKETKLGRPKSNPSESQKSCVSVWFTKAEKETVRQAAAVAECPVSMWARKTLKEAAKRALAAVGL